LPTRRTIAHIVPPTRSHNIAVGKTRSEKTITSMMVFAAPMKPSATSVAETRAQRRALDGGPFLLEHVDGDRGLGHPTADVRTLRAV
jgi:hypothetical protein